MNQPLNKPKTTKILLYFFLILSLVSVILFSLPNFALTQDERANVLLSATLPRLAVSAFLTVAVADSAYAHALRFPLQGFLRSLLWCIPCFLVAVVNFPFSALLNGAATLERVDLVWLFALQCLAVGWMEELFFRGLLFPIMLKKLKNTKHGIFFSVVLSSACFSLMHLLNLFTGASASGTALQIGYTFLIGCMFAVTFLRTNNVWLCVIIHALFNFGGGIVTYVGSGPFQDTLFWIFTAVAGVICTVHILLSLRRLIQSDVQNSKND